MNDWLVYTDGAYKSSVKRGGVGVVWIKDGKKVCQFSRGYDNTTNNQMELLAIGYALHSFKKPINSLAIVSDSAYALGCIFNDSWKPRKNVNLINTIKIFLHETQLITKEEITYIKVRGHQIDDSDHTKWNNLCDKLASNASLSI